MSEKRSGKDMAAFPSGVDAIGQSPVQAEMASVKSVKVRDGADDYEVFRQTDEGVNYRTLSWQWASVIFLKMTFATGVMTIPSAVYVLGVAPGAINVVGWGVINTYAGVVQGNFRNSHPMCHSVADMAQVVGGSAAREVAGLCFIASWTIVAASAITVGSTALNALSTHALCTNWFSLIVTAVVMVVSSFRRFEELGWLSWAGFLSVFSAVFIVVVGVTLNDRPAAAPPTGDFDLGYHIISHPSFAQGISAAATIFCSSAGTSGFLPVISEMRKPKDYKKSLYICMFLVTASYLAFSMVVYRWCGKWVASPSLGSAGPTLKKVSYGVGLLGILVTGCLYVHLSAKYIFVRVLRNSRHLQSNTLVHWGTWLGCTVGLSITAFLLSAAIPIFNHLLSLAGSLGFAPIALVLPPWLWIYDHQDWRTASSPIKRVVYFLHYAWILLGLLIVVGGTYGVIDSVKQAYQDGTIGSAFSCADNSGST